MIESNDELWFKKQINYKLNILAGYLVILVTTTSLYLNHIDPWYCTANKWLLKLCIIPKSLSQLTEREEKAQK